MGAVKRVAVVGSGISGLSAAWLLSRGYEVTLFEADARPGGHANTVDVPRANGGSGTVPVDTGFIVYNTARYPNLVALFDHLGVPTAPTDMSFAVSIDAGAYEYAGTSLTSLFGQPANLFRRDHWRMLADLLRFFREGKALEGAALDFDVSLGDYLEQSGYSDAFVRRHILPMAAAIWSTQPDDVLDHPVATFVRFFANHGLLDLKDRPPWRTVVGGSREYVKRLLADFQGEVRLGNQVNSICRTRDGVSLSVGGGVCRFDACVIATPANQALRLLADPSDDEQRLLKAFRYNSNTAVLHSDVRMMPRRRRLWSSWNYIGCDERYGTVPAVTYWMNRLQPLGPDAPACFVTLNPAPMLPSESIVALSEYSHPMFDAASMQAQRELWRLQGRRRTWFSGSYFGYGFHEDGLQSGLAAAEDIGGVRRPWRVAGESGRIHLGPPDEKKGRAREPMIETAE
jgi:predicted NAD/FAD-binding protein